MDDYYPRQLQLDGVLEQDILGDYLIGGQNVLAEVRNCLAYDIAHPVGRLRITVEQIVDAGNPALGKVEK